MIGLIRVAVCVEAETLEVTMTLGKRLPVPAALALPAVAGACCTLFKVCWLLTAARVCWLTSMRQ